MFISISSLVLGTTNLRIEAIHNHAVSKSHLLCERAAKAQEVSRPEPHLVGGASAGGAHTRACAHELNKWVIFIIV